MNLELGLGYAVGVGRAQDLWAAAATAGLRQANGGGWWGFIFHTKYLAAAVLFWWVASGGLHACCPSLHI